MPISVGGVEFDTGGSNSPSAKLGNNVSRGWQDVSGGTARGRANEAKGRAEQQRTDIYAKTRGYNSNQTGIDDQYYNANKDAAGAYQKSRNASQAPYLGRMDEFDGELKDQANQADETYTGSVKPGLTELMETAQRDSRSAMSLEDYMNPNNKVHTANRDMYEQQAQGVGKQGLASAGMLQSMGAQAAAQQFGSGPMTTGMMGQIYGANQNQAGQAYARTQQQMQSLREQGINRGYEQNDKAYGAGIDAQARHRGSIADLASAETDYFNKKGGIRDERGNIAGQKMGIGVGNASQDFGLQTGLNSQRHSNQSGRVTRDMTTDQQEAGGNIAAQNAEIARQNAAAEGKAGQFGQMTGIAGGVLGGIYGGPAGAQAGYAGGQALGGAAAGGGSAGTGQVGGAPGAGANYGFTGQQQQGSYGSNPFSGGGYGSGFAGNIFAQQGQEPSRTGSAPYAQPQQQQYNPNTYNPGAFGGFAGMGARS